MILVGDELTIREHGTLHPYLDIYLRCKKYGNGINGAPCLPMSGGLLDQDAELMYAFDRFGEIEAKYKAESEAEDERRKKQMEMTPQTVI